MTQFMDAAQNLGGESVVQLFQLDLSPLGDPTVMFFTKEMKNAAGTGRVSFLGQEYDAVDVEVDGFEWSGTGPMPQPTIRITNVNRLMSGLILGAKHLVGARVSRLRTFKRFLDGQPDAAEAPYAFTWDTFNVEQKTGHNKTSVEFRLSSMVDQQGRMLPVRQVLRDTCLSAYRKWNPVSGTFDYSKAVCPYTGTAYFDLYGNPTSADKDRPSRKVETCCKKRFGATAVLPFGGFPGVARTR